MRVLDTGIDIGIQSVLSTGNNTLLALAVVNGLLHLPVPVLLSQSSGFSTVTHIFSRCHDNIGCSHEFLMLKIALSLLNFASSPRSPPHVQVTASNTLPPHFVLVNVSAASRASGPGCECPISPPARNLGNRTL